MRCCWSSSIVRWTGIVRELERIWVSLSFDGLGEYNHALKARILDERYVAAPATTLEQIASTIVHEATHAVRYLEASDWLNWSHFDVSANRHLGKEIVPYWGAMNGPPAALADSRGGWHVHKSIDFT